MNRKPSTPKVWKTDVNSLRAFCPLRYPAQVSRAKLPEGDHGDCTWNPKKRKFLIRVTSRVPYDFQLWILAHEWAHAMVWHIPQERDGHHNPYFGIAFDRALRALHPDW